MSAYKPIKDCETVAELLEDPARWCANARIYERERWCILWAIDRIYGCGGFRANDAYRTILETLRESFGLNGLHNVSWWETRPSRTHAEVLAAVRKAGI